MRGKKLFVIILLLVTCYAFLSCRRFVEVPPPQTQLVNTSVFSDVQTATAALLSIYGGYSLQGESWNMSQNCGLLSDELDGIYSRDNMVVQYYTNTMAPNSFFGPWKNAYNYIFQVNAIIEGVSKNDNINEKARYQIVGEAMFLRAFWYFYLTNCYGDVPLITTTDYKINAILGRSSSAVVYDQILSDLRVSKEYLSDHFVDQTDTAVSQDRVRPTKWAAYALLARAYLFKKIYDSAVVYATKVIDNTALFNLEDSVDNVFLKNSKEAIWQLAVPNPQSTLSNTYDANNFILIASPSNGNINTATISSSLLDSFEIGDKRKGHWIGAFPVVGVDTFYFPYKYKQFRSTIIKEYTMMIRLAEIFLIRSEARTMNNDLAGGVDDLNKIRTRAGLDAITANSDQSSILSAIWRERRVELFCEWGHRWFDLIRTGKIDEVMSVVTASKGGTWRATDRLYPIPQVERNINVNLTQNAGY